MMIKNVLVSISLLIFVTIYASYPLDIAQIRADKIEELYTVCAKIAEKESAINAIIESSSSSLDDINDSLDVQRKECVTKLAHDLELCMQELLECALFLMMEMYILDQDENIKKYCESLKVSIEQYTKACEGYLNQLATSFEMVAELVQ